MKKIQGFENYEVDELGQIWSLPKRTRKGTRLIKPLQHPKTGYMYVDLCKDGKVKKFSAHRLVALTYLPNLENKPQVNHINGIKTDNRVENLEWNTNLENKQHAVNSGLTNLKGVNHPKCKLSEKQVLEIREIGFSQTRTSLSKKYGVCRNSILRIIMGKNWNHI